MQRGRRWPRRSERWERTREILNTGTKEIAESHRFDEAALDVWMQANVAGYHGPLEVRQFKGGQIADLSS